MKIGTSLSPVVKTLHSHCHGPGLIPGQGARSHMPQINIPCAATKTCMLSCFSRVRLFATSWTVAPQAPLSMEFPRQEYWSGLPFPSPGDLHNQGIKLTSLSFLCLLQFFTTNASWEAHRKEN